MYLCCCLRMAVFFEEPGIILNNIPDTILYCIILYYMKRYSMIYDVI